MDPYVKDILGVVPSILKSLECLFVFDFGRGGACSGSASFAADVPQWGRQRAVGEANRGPIESSCRPDHPKSMYYSGFRVDGTGRHTKKSLVLINHPTWGPRRAIGPLNPYFLVGGPASSIRMDRATWSPTSPPCIWGLRERLHEKRRLNPQPPWTGADARYVGCTVVRLVGRSTQLPRDPVDVRRVLGSASDRVRKYRW